LIEVLERKRHCRGRVRKAEVDEGLRRTDKLGDGAEGMVEDRCER
jgi:hypothetical protein